MTAVYTTTTYNGWTNYATWRVNLEICDDLCNSYVSDLGDIDKFVDVAALAARLQEEVDDILTNYGELKDGLALDYARSFVSDVNWYEIAEHWTDELVEGGSPELDTTIRTFQHELTGETVSGPLSKIEWRIEGSDSGHWIDISHTAALHRRRAESQQKRTQS